MHLGITGTKKGVTEPQFDIVKSFILEDTTVTHLHEGDCVGVDHQVTLLFQEYKPNVQIVCHPPIKPHYRAYGPYDILNEEKDYLVRDKDNVDESDYLWACPDGAERIRSGTWTTVRYARKKGIPITIIMPNGEVIYED
jgi:hypothetical protein